MVTRRQALLLIVALATFAGAAFAAGDATTPATAPASGVAAAPPPAPPAAPPSGPTTATAPVAPAAPTTGAAVDLVPPSAGAPLIKGYIERAKLDDEGNTAEIGVWDEAAQEFFIISPEGPGAELKGHVGERLEATGAIREEDGQKILVVKTVNLVKEERPAEPEGVVEDEGSEESSEGAPPAADGTPAEGTEGTEGTDENPESSEGTPDASPTPEGSEGE
jgi:hypothetical protein